MSTKRKDSSVAASENGVTLVLSSPAKGEGEDNGYFLANGHEINEGTNGDVWKSKESSGTPTTLNGIGSPSEKPAYKKIRLPWSQRFCYSVGHVYNDLCASMWFTYMLLYLTSVLKFSESNAGILVLVGQVADAVATPFVGLASDKQHSMKICRYGRRKIWHLIGTICVTVSFPFLFIPCLGCEHTEYSMQMIYYGSFIILFQFGWASVQVAHLSLIPDLSRSPNERTELSAYRNAFTVISSICVYSITWAVLGTTNDSSTIGPSDEDEFRTIVLIVTGIGIVFAIIFHVGVKEPTPPPKLKKIVKNIVQEQQLTTTEQMKPPLNGHTNGVMSPSDGHIVEQQKPKQAQQMVWRDWLKMKEFYKVAIMYMCTRLFVNISQTYITLYLQDSLKLSKDSVAIIPLVVYVCGFFASLCMKLLNKKAGRQTSYVIGALFGIGFCIWVYFGSGQQYQTYEIYGVAALMGIGGSVVLVTCLSITSDLIGNNVRSGAFVYGAMSFADKLSNGIVVIIVQFLFKKSTTYYKNVLTFGSGGPQLVALITVFTLKKSLLNTNRRGTIRIETEEENEVSPAPEAVEEVKRF